MEAKPFRVVVANEPRAYREIIAACFRALRPHADVIAVEPVALERELDACRPHVVICSRRSDAVRFDSPVWIVLYPDGEALAVVTIEGRETVIPNIEFAELLSVLDRTEHLAQLS